jgi:hypothetical protein
MDDHELEPTELLVLSDRTTQRCHGILRNAYIAVENFVYPIDFYIIDILNTIFFPIILVAPFYVLTKLNIDSKKEVMSLQLVEEEVNDKFKELKKFPYEKEAGVKEEKTIEELAAI